ncbi:MAG: class I SAM-dependent methyltransferase [Candidatus Schekmanbacteria bacterium]|nr:MAG: class I SAM-dependent methyltransferase [Candidatus Schekmanbacteria bacterium]
MNHKELNEKNSIFDCLFTAQEIEKRKELWKVLCDDFFSKFINRADTVVDLGAGYCEFINNIKCRKKIAVDLNRHPKKYANDDVEVIISPATTVAQIEDNFADVVFTSNFWEHMRDREEMKRTLIEVKRILKPSGKLIILQPNIRYSYKVYWDFFDHIIPLSHKSMEEILRFMGFKIKYIQPKFLPYSTKSKWPQSAFLVKLYLKMPFLHYIFGKQMVIVAEKGD